MARTYHLPSKADELEDGILSSAGGLAWSKGRAYVWPPSGAWASLPTPHAPIEDGFRTSKGVLTVTEDNELGFWGFGNEGWTWWMDESELSFSSAYPPIGDYFVAERRQKFDERRLLVYRVSTSGLEPQVTVDTLPDLSGTVDLAFVQISGEASAPTEGSPRLILLSGETLYWRLLTAEATSFQTVRLTVKKEVRWFTDGFPPTIKGVFSPFPPQLFGNTLFLHRGSTSPETSLAVDLEEYTVEATGLAPLGRSVLPWKAYIDKEPDRLDDLIDTLCALPSPGEERVASAIELIDVEMRGETVNAVLSDCGICVGDSLPSADVSNDLGPVDLENGLLRDTPLTWRLWRGQSRAEQALYRKVTSEVVGGELCVEPLQVQVGIDACSRFLDELRGDNPPRSTAGDFGYNDRNIQNLFGPYGQEVADLVEEALTDEHAPVRVAACMAAGITDEDRPSILMVLDQEPIPASTLWPDRDALPRRALWENLAHEASEVREAAAKTCGLLRLSESALDLQSLLYAEPLLESDNEEVRKTALEALRLVPELPRSVLGDIKDCARSDPSARIRSTAVKSLASHSHETGLVDTLIWALGDSAPRVAGDIADGLMEQARKLTPDQYNELVDRWLLRYLGYRRSDDVSAFRASFPEELPGNILGQRILPEEMQDASPSAFLEDVELEDLNITEETLQIAPAALSLVAVQTAVFEETPLRVSAGEESTEGSEFERKLKEHLSGKTFLSEIDDSTFTHQAPSMQAAELATSIYERDARLGRRLAAIVLFELGLPPRKEGNGEEEGYRPLHSRLRDLSKESPHEQCHRFVWELSGKNGTGRLLGLYVLATLGDKEAENLLLDQYTTGRLKDVPIAWSLLRETKPFSKRPRAFTEGALLGRYLSCDNVPLARRWEAYQDLYLPPRAEAVATDHIPVDTWILFFEECVGARNLFSWRDRHGAALHLAWLDNQHGRPAELWKERTNSIGGVPDDERPGYVRDQLWVGDGEYWTEFWQEYWPEEFGDWDLRMLADRGGDEAASRIEAALENDAFPEQPATETIKEIRAREIP